MINLESGEKIIMEARRHWFSIGTTGVSIFFLAVAPIILFAVVAYVFPEIDIVINDPRFNAIFLLFGATWLLVLWIIFFMAWTDYYLDVLVITNKRLIDVEQQGLFRRDVATAPIGNIQDVKIEIKGPIRSILGFGNIFVQTGSVERELLIKDIRLPDKVKEVILAAHHAHINPVA